MNNNTLYFIIGFFSGVVCTIIILIWAHFKDTSFDCILKENPPEKPKINFEREE